MPEADPAMYRACLDDALKALQQSIGLLTGAAIYAANADQRESAMAPVAGLELAAQHIAALVAVATN